eukprot:scaffold1868_cov194-Alexandrium_tamarense.AAC.15
MVLIRRIEGVVGHSVGVLMKGSGSTCFLSFTPVSLKRALLTKLPKEVRNLLTAKIGKDDDMVASILGLLGWQSGRNVRQTYPVQHFLLKATPNAFLHPM